VTSAGVAFLALLTAAQAPGSGPKDAPQPTLTHPSEPLLAYRGEEVAVRYSPGALDRALHVVKRLDLIVAELKGPLAIMVPLTAVVLTRDEWEDSNLTRTYGLPQPLSIGSIAVPAAGDAGTVRKWKSWLGTELPGLAGMPLVGTAEEAASLMLSDVVLQVEVCELLLDRTPMAQAEPWIRGLVSHLAALSLWSVFEPRRTEEIAMIWSRIRGQIPPLLALEQQLERPTGSPLAMERWLLAESYLFEGASLAHATGGAKSFQKLLRTLRREQRAPTREEMLVLYPSLAGWLEALPPETGLR
jgi:hypothetical protein